MDFGPNFDKTPITDEFVGGTTATDVIFKRVNKLLVRFQPMSINDRGASAHKDRSGHRTIINSRDIRVDDIRGHVLITTWNVDSRIWGLEELLKTLNVDGNSKILQNIG